MFDRFTGNPTSSDSSSACMLIVRPFAFMSRSGMPCRTRMRPPRFRTKDVSTCMGSPTARGSSIRKPFARGGCCLLVSELDRHLGIRPVSQLDTQPVVSPVNASRLPSRAETSCITRGRGGWLSLTPWKTCTSYPLPAFLAHSQPGHWRNISVDRGIHRDGQPLLFLLR